MAPTTTFMITFLAISLTVVALIITYFLVPPKDNLCMKIYRKKGKYRFKVLINNEVTGWGTDSYSSYNEARRAIIMLVNGTNNKSYKTSEKMEYILDIRGGPVVQFVSKQRTSEFLSLCHEGYKLYG